MATNFVYVNISRIVWNVLLLPILLLHCWFEWNPDTVAMTFITMGMTFINKRSVKNNDM